jgi:hypothetical protein
VEGNRRRKRGEDGRETRYWIWYSTRSTQPASPDTHHPLTSDEKIPEKFLLPTCYEDHKGNDNLEETEVKLGFILNEDLFCFLMTRKVSTTCSKNARAGSWIASESSFEPDSAMSLHSLLSYNCGRSIG